MLWNFDPQGRVVIGKEVLERCGITIGDKVVFQEISNTKFRILAEKDSEFEEVIAVPSATVDAKGRIFFPSKIREKYEKNFKVSYNVSERSIYITFFDFAE